MKRLFACVLVAIMVIMAFSACGNKEETPSPDESKQNNAGTPSDSSSTGDNTDASKSFSELLPLVDTSSEAGLVNSANGLALKLNSDGKSYTVVGRGTHTAAALVIDDSYNGLPITCVGESAFFNQKDITSITVGNNITKICRGAFRDCTGVVNIASVTIPDTVITIEGTAFMSSGIWNSNKWLADSGQKALYIGNHLIRVSTSISGAFEVKEGTKSITDWAFEYCTQITSITIPDSVIRIGAYAFEGCKGITSITIPSGVTSLEDQLFFNCQKLSSITIKGNITHIGSQTFGRTLYYHTDSNWSGNVLYYGNYLLKANEVSNTYTVPDGTTVIADFAFYGCTELKGVVLPSTLKAIGNHSFDGCRNLSNLIIPNSVTTIGESAFDTCISLKTVRIPTGITSISDYAFYNCSGLESVSIPNSVTKIGEFSFYGCTKLTGVNIPKNVNTIGSSAFANCAGLKSISVDTSNTTYKSLGESLYTYDGKTLLQYSIGKPDATFIVPDGVTTIGPRAFYGSTILETVELPKTVQNIDSTAFNNCNRLSSIKKVN